MVNETTSAAQHSSLESPADKEESLTPDDPLLAALLLLSKMLTHPVSEESLLSGLPLENGRLTPALFPKAAQRASLSARVVERPLLKIPNLIMPALLLLKDAQVCIVLKTDRLRDLVTVIFPETGDGEACVSRSELERRYTGYAIFIKPEHNFDTRTANEQATPQAGHWFWGTLKRSWRIYRDVLIASLLVNLFALASPIFIMNVYDRVVPHKSYETLWVLVVGMGIVYIFDLLLRGLRGYFLDLAGKKADITLSSQIFERVLGLKMEQRPQSVGAFANNLGEFENLRNFITSFTITTLIDLPFVLLFLVAITWIGGSIVFIPLLGIPLMVLYALFIQLPLREAVENIMRTSSQKNATLIEALFGIEAVKTSRAEGQLQKQWEQATGDMARWSIRSRLLASSATNVALFLQQISTIGVVAYGVYLVSGNELSLGGLIACVILSSRAMAPWGQVTNIAAHFLEARNTLKTLDHIMGLPIERQSASSYVNKSQVDGAIAFEHVSYSYPGQPADAVSDLSFTIAPGEHVAIIGRTGSGKTTIQKLLTGLYEPSTGTIRADGIDIRQIDPGQLRKNIGYVPQEVMLFYGSLRDNIAFGAPYVEDEQVIAAADIAGVTEIASRHPRGFDMPLGERGAALSGGQRQEVMVARALINDPQILLMDEPTSSMDNTTETRLVGQLTNYLQGKTLLLVTHRASLLTLVDRLIVIEQGRIMLDGPKEAVLKELAEGHLSHG